MEEERRNEYEAGSKKKGMSAGAKAVLIICIVLAVLALTFTGIIIFVMVKIFLLYHPHSQNCRRISMIMAATMVTICTHRMRMMSITRN